MTIRWSQIIITTDHHPADPEQISTQVKTFTKQAVRKRMTEIIVGKVQAYHSKDTRQDMHGFCFSGIIPVLNEPVYAV